MTGPERVSRMRQSRNVGTGVRVSNSRTGKDRFRVTWKQIVLIVGMLCTILCGGISYVWSNFEGTQIGYSMSQMQKEEMRLRGINQALRAQLAYMKSPQEVEKRAVTTLRMRQPSRNQIVVLP